MRRNNLELASFSAIHFLVDLTCVFLVTAFLLPVMPEKSAWIYCALTYNLFAFAFQLPVGALGDVLGSPKRIAAIGCLLVASAYIVVGLLALPKAGVFIWESGKENVSALFGLSQRQISLWAFVGATIAGIGNSCFHVGGGINTIHQSGGKATRPGIFVATGAMGVFLASKAPVNSMAIMLSFGLGIVLMLVSASLLFYLSRADIAESPSDAKSRKKSDSGLSLPAFLGIAFLLITVCLRSYTGGLFAYPWKSSPLLATLFVLGVVAGKMAGGILGDRFGWERSSVISLLVSVVLFHFAPTSPFCGIAGVLMFNMTMPITLMAIANRLGEGMSGTAFGMTTMALFLGTLPSTFEMLTGRSLSNAWMVPITIIASAIAIYLGIVLTKTTGENGTRQSQLSDKIATTSDGALER